MSHALAMRRRWLAAVPALALAVCLGLVARGAATVTILLTADTEGQLTPCQVCPVQAAPGGMARRATIVNERRRDDPSLLLVDAGNTLFGIDSIESGGRVMVAAYEALRYDAVNLSYRDFRLGKAHTLTVLGGARFPVVSCNLVDSVTGRPLASPFVVRRVGNERVAILGVTELPGATDLLPHLEQELAGIRVQPPLAALETWLPRATREADRAVLLFYGSAVGLGAIERKFGGELNAILVGGIPFDALPGRSRPLVAGTAEQGKTIGEIRLSTDGHDVARQLPVAPSVGNDPKMTDLLNSYRQTR